MNREIFSTFVNVDNEEEYFEKIVKELDNNKTAAFFYQNSYSFYLASKSQKFLSALNKADYIIPDGLSSVILIKYILNIKIKKVVFSYFFFSKLNHFFAQRKTKIFLLGAKPEIIEESALILKRDYKLNITGFSHGYFDDSESDELIRKINLSGTDVLIVGMGMPRSEIWIQNNKHKLKLRIIFSVGGFFDYVSKRTKLAPKFLYNSGFEWLYRLIQEPRRLFKRYLLSNCFFIKLLLVSFCVKITKKKV